MLATGFSRAQMNRLLSRKLYTGAIKELSCRRNRFRTIYTRGDIELLAETDNLHERMSGPATKVILKRQHEQFKDARFERLKGISSAHIYNLRESPAYKVKAITVGKTKSVQNTIGVRGKPNPGGKPGHLRVDTVHQGDSDKAKGPGRRGNPVGGGGLRGGQERQRHPQAYGALAYSVRPCGFATVTVDEKGKRHKNYEIYQTPYEALRNFPDAAQYLKDGVTFEQLDRIAMAESDNECAKLMQKEKSALFRKVRPAGLNLFQKGGPPANTLRNNDE